MAPVTVRLLQKVPGNLPEGFRIPAFAAEAQMGDHAQPVQQGHSPGGELFGAGEGVQRRQLQHQVRAAQKGHPCPDMLVQHGRRPALDEIPAHDHDGIVCLREMPGLLQLVQMSVVERVIFGYDSVYFHAVPPVSVGLTIFRIKISNDNVKKIT